jgi:hypothetical protein
MAGGGTFADAACGGAATVMSEACRSFWPHRAQNSCEAMTRLAPHNWQNPSEASGFSVMVHLKADGQERRLSLLPLRYPV